MSAITPDEAAQHALPVAPPARSGVDQVTGHGVMGVPFASGDYLALRCWPVASFGAGYTSVWHRSLTGRWTIYADVAPEVSCARFMGRAADETRTEQITVSWPDQHRLMVRVGSVLEWTVDLAPTAATRALTAAASALPAWVWEHDASLDLMGVAARAVLRTGRLQFAGTTPNGHLFSVRCRRVWALTGTAARLLGHDLGPELRPPSPLRFGDIWLPRRGVFFADTTATFVRPSP